METEEEIWLVDGWTHLTNRSSSIFKTLTFSEIPETIFHEWFLNIGSFQSMELKSNGITLKETTFYRKQDKDLCHLFPIHLGKLQPKYGCLLC